MMKKIEKLWCFLRGHDFVKTSHIDNGRSQFGEYECVRCGKTHSWQYDYGHW